jgi:hypothetical protein
VILPVVVLVVVIVVVAFVRASPKGEVPDPFRSGLPGARIVIDAVACDHPDNCTRYVVLEPRQSTTDGVLTAATVRATEKLGWKPTQHPEVVEADQGTGFDGDTSSTGGFINTTKQELHFWNRVGFTDSIPPDKTELAVAAAMRAAPSGVIVRIITG